MQEKTFLTINDLIKNMENKNIIINNKEVVEQILEINNYYFIMGYKFAFRDNNGVYKKNTSFEDIYLLYKFDKRLKLIILDPLLIIEQKLKTVYMNNYSYRYGFKKADLLNSNNYDISNIYLNDKLSSLEKQLDIFGSKNKAILFYQKHHTFIPLWVYMKILSFGMIRDMFYVSKASDKDYMSRKLSQENMGSNEIANMLRLLVRIRNICCHDDILLSFVDDKLGIKNTKYHKIFNLKKDRKGNITQGKKDLLAVLISIKIFIGKDTFNKLIDNIYTLVGDYDKKISSLTRKQLLELMHLPSDFEKLKRI